MESNVDNFSWLGSVFDFLNSTEVMGMSLTTYCCIALLLGAVVLFIRGNK